MKYFLPIFLAFLLLIFAVSADTGNADVARIHIIANSDSAEDVEVKLKVAEAVAELLSDKSFDSTVAMAQGLEKSIDEIEERANGILTSEGVDYTASADVGMRYFDRRTLGNSAFPQGEYLALTIVLGEGRGHNWWSVMFPRVSLEASLAMGEEGSVGKTVLLGGDTIVKIRCLIFDLCNLILTKK